MKSYYKKVYFYLKQGYFFLQVYSLLRMYPSIGSIPSIATTAVTVAVAGCNEALITETEDRVSCSCLVNPLECECPRAWRIIAQYTDVYLVICQPT